MLQVVGSLVKNYLVNRKLRKIDPLTTKLFQNKSEPKEDIFIAKFSETEKRDGSLIVVKQQMILSGQSVVNLA